MTGPFDLVVVVPDAHWRAVLVAILGRPKALGIRPLALREPLVHPHRDPGVRSTGVQLLRPFCEVPRAHALLVLDHDGCGFDGSAQELQERLQRALESDWADRAWAVVVEPELESWLVGGHEHLPTLIGRREVEPPRAWWRARGYWPDGLSKPERPKEALEAWLSVHRERPTASLWRELAARGSLRPERCRHQAYRRMVERLRAWFPEADPPGRP